MRARVAPQRIILIVKKIKPIFSTIENYRKVIHTKCINAVIFTKKCLLLNNERYNINKQNK
jgi:hypothetical protein